MILRTRCVLVYSVFKVRGPNERSRTAFTERGPLLRVRARLRLLRPLTLGVRVPFVRRSKITPIGT